MPGNARHVPCAMLLLLLMACTPGEKPAETPLASADVRERGRRLVEQYQCGSCHVIPDVAAAQGRVATSLENFGRRSYIAGRVANQPEFLAAWIVDPQSVSPGATMPRMGVQPAEARDMAAFLLSLR